MRRFSLCLAVFFVSGFVQAQTKVDVPPFANETRAGRCNAVEAWKDGIGEAFAHQLINSLNGTGLFTVVPPERLRGEQHEPLLGTGVSTVHKKATVRSAKYSIKGSLKSFDICDKGSEVVLDLRVVDLASGELAHRFEIKGHAPGNPADKNSSYKGATFNTGVFKDSSIGRATQAAIGDATDKLKKAFPKREIATEGYKVKTFRKSRR